MPFPEDQIDTTSPENKIDISLPKEHEMPEYDITDVTEFPPRNTKIKRELIKGGTIEELIAFRDSNDLSDEDIAYLNGRIKAEEFYKKLFAGKLKKNIPEVAYDETGAFKMDIEQTQFQTSKNGCYSASMEMLFRSRGIELDQKKIRSFRPTNDGSNDTIERTISDVPSNVRCLSGIVTRALPNTALVTKEFSCYDEISKEAMKKEMRETIMHSLLDNKSPISLVYRGHYKTIIGFDEQTNEIIYKDSYPYLSVVGTTAYDEENRETLDEIFIHSYDSRNGIFAVGMSYLLDLNPENPTQGITEIENLEYINNQFIVNNNDLLGIEKDTMKQDGQTLTSYKQQDELIINSTVSVPYEFVPTAEMVQNHFEYPKVLTKEEDPKKQELYSEIQNNRLTETIPADAKLKYDAGKKVFDATLSDGSKTTYQLEDVARVIYYNKLSSKIDELTPWQVDNVLDETRLISQADKITRSKDFTETLAFTKNKELNINSFQTQYKITVESDNAETTYKQKGMLELVRDRMKLYDYLKENAAKLSEDEAIKLGANMKAIDEKLMDKGLQSSSQIKEIAKLADTFKTISDAIATMLDDTKFVSKYLDNQEKVVEEIAKKFKINLPEPEKKEEGPSLQQ